MKSFVKFFIPFILVILIPIIYFLKNNENEIQKYDRVTQKVFDQFHTTGLNVAIIKDGNIIYEKSLGYKNINNLTYLNNNAVFNIASCTKAFTAAAIGKLVQEGLLSWDDKVTDYIPEFKLADDCTTENLKFRDILSHRTGLGTFYGDLLWYYTDYSNEQVIERMQYLPLKYDFRTNFGYQNNMYTIAGEIIEKVTGQDWEDFIQQTFFEPLEMKSSRTSSDKFDGTEDIAFPHYNDSTLGIYYFSAGKPAASIWSSTRDLANWVNMLLNDGKWKNEQILSPEIIQTLITPHTIKTVSKEYEKWGTHFRTYALGWNVYDYNGRKVIEHDGGMPGYISKVAWIPEENMGVIILNNGFDIFANDVLIYSYLDIVTEKYTKDWVEDFLTSKNEYTASVKQFQEKRLTTKMVETTPSVPLNKYTGIYRDKMYGDAEITIDNNELNFTLIPAKRVFTSKMQHWADDVFRVDFIKDPYLNFGLIKFEINESEVTGFTIDLPSSDFHFENLKFTKISK